MSSVKIERLNSNIVKEISYILMEEIKDDDIQFVTVTDCEVTNDLSFAKIYFTVLDKTKKESTLKALNHASSYIRGELSQRIEVRHTPELTFVYDDSIEHGQKIEKIIEEINKEEENM